MDSRYNDGRTKVMRIITRLNVGGPAIHVTGLNAGLELKLSRSAVGGGSLPGETLPTWVLAITCSGGQGGPEEVMGRLRRADPPVVARIEDNQVMLDPRTVLPEEEENMLRSLQTALEGR